jgi:predicted nuclease with TOPRIM domain
LNSQLSEERKQTNQLREENEELKRKLSEANLKIKDLEKVASYAARPPPEYKRPDYSKPAEYVAKREEYTRPDYSQMRTQPQSRQQSEDFTHRPKSYEYVPKAPEQY